MIFECGPEGPDKRVCTSLARRIVNDIVIEPATLDNKKKLIEECGRATSVLLASGCHHVLIIWDLYPAWRSKGQKPCCHEDRQSIFSSLSDAGVDVTKVTLICIHAELEAWLIADGRALSAVLSTPSHPKSIAHHKNSERIKNPKSELVRIFTNNIGRQYSDLSHAQRIVDAIPDLSRLRRISSFTRFEEKLKNM